MKLPSLSRSYILRTLTPTSSVVEPVHFSVFLLYFVFLTRKALRPLSCAGSGAGRAPQCAAAAGRGGGASAVLARSLGSPARSGEAGGGQRAQVAARTSSFLSFSCLLSSFLFLSFSHPFVHASFQAPHPYPPALGCAARSRNSEHPSPKPKRSNEARRNCAR